MSLHLKEAKLNELQEVVKRLEEEIKKEKEKWKANDTLWAKLTNLDEYLKYKGYIHASKVTTKGFGHSNPKARAKKTLLYINPDNGKQGWSGEGSKPEWINVEMKDIEKYPEYIHPKHPRYEELVPEDIRDALKERRKVK